MNRFLTGRVRRGAAALGLALGLVVTAGCGGDKAAERPNTAEVSGKVTYKSQPVTGGTIIFRPIGSSAVKGQGGAPLDYTFTIKPDGTYVAAGLPAGSYQVGVQPVTGSAPMPGRGKERPPMGAATETRPMPNFPQKYTNPATSGQTKEVKAGKEEINIDLT